MLLNTALGRTSPTGFINTFCGSNKKKKHTPNEPVRLDFNINH